MTTIKTLKGLTKICKNVVTYKGRLYTLSNDLKLANVVVNTLEKCGSRCKCDEKRLGGLPHHWEGTEEEDTRNAIRKGEKMEMRYFRNDFRGRIHLLV